jgi:RNA polymerase sigma-70 factor, ECF subfamily
MIDDIQPVVDSSEDTVQKFEDLVRAHAREIEGFLAKLCGNRHDAEELAQDVFVKAFRKIATLRDPLAARRWLYTIAVNHFNDWIAPRHREAMAKLDDAEDTLAGRERAPAEQASAAELEGLLRASIRRLPERQRIVLLLFTARGFDYSDIALALGISPEAVKVSLFHAREKLRSKVKHFMRNA